jgi:hypothetical protein
MIVNLCGLLFHDRKGRGEWMSCRPTTPLTHDNLRAFAEWAKKQSRNANLNGGLPTSPLVLQNQISEFMTIKNAPTKTTTSTGKEISPTLLAIREQARREKASWGELWQKEVQIQIDQAGR